MSHTVMDEIMERVRRDVDRIERIEDLEPDRPRLIGMTIATAVMVLGAVVFLAWSEPARLPPVDTGPPYHGDR